MVPECHILTVIVIYVYKANSSIWDVPCLDWAKLGILQKTNYRVSLYKQKGQLTYLRIICPFYLFLF